MSRLTVYGGGGGTSPLTAKGDLYGYTTQGARVPVGADGQVLAADSTQALGVGWANVPPPYPAIRPNPGDFITTSTHGDGNGVATTLPMTGGQIVWVRLFVSQPTTPDLIRVNVTTASTSGVIRVGAFTYDMPSGTMTLIEDYGSASTATTGNKDIVPVIGTLLPVAWYFVGLFPDQGCTLQAVGQKSGMAHNGLLLGGAQVTKTVAYGPFAASYTSLTTPSGNLVVALGLSD